MIVEKLLKRAEGGDLQAIREIFDRLDGRPMQAVERDDTRLEDMTDQQLMAVIRGGLPQPLLLTLGGSHGSMRTPGAPPSATANARATPPISNGLI